MKIPKHVLETGIWPQATREYFSLGAGDYDQTIQLSTYIEFDKFYLKVVQRYVTTEGVSLDRLEDAFSKEVDKIKDNFKQLDKMELKRWEENGMIVPKLEWLRRIGQ